MARQKEDTKTGSLQLHASSGAKRQAELKARREAAGFKRTTVWVRQADYEAGIDAAQLGSANAGECPEGRDRLSWMMGFCAELERVRG